MGSRGPLSSACLPASAGSPGIVRPASPEEAMATLAQLAGALGGGARPAGHPLASRFPPAETAEDGASLLRHVEARFRTLVEQIPAVTFMASLDGGLNDVYVSPQIEELLGYAQEEWLSDPVLWFRRLHPDDRGLWTREFARGCRTGGPFHAECRFLARDGSIVWVRGDAAIQRDERGRPLFLQGVAFDITDSKRVEEVTRASLREKETLLKEIHHRVKEQPPDDIHGAWLLPRVIERQIEEILMAPAPARAWVVNEPRMRPPRPRPWGSRGPARHIRIGARLTRFD